MLKSILTLAITVSIALGALSPGEKAPELVVPKLDGQIFDLSALHGKVVLIHFWATWCPGCKEEMPILSRFYDQNHAKGVEAIGISVDRARERENVRAEARAFSYPSALASDAKSNGFNTPSSLPLTYVIDRNGLVSAKLSPTNSPLTEKILSDLVLPLLDKKF